MDVKVVQLIVLVADGPLLHAPERDPRLGAGLVEQFPVDVKVHAVHGPREHERTLGRRWTAA